MEGSHLWGPSPWQSSHSPTSIQLYENNIFAIYKEFPWGNQL